MLTDVFYWEMLDVSADPRLGALPATRLQDEPMNLRLGPSSPTRVAVSFDLVASAASVHWEAGAGETYAQNEAFGWIIELLGVPAGGNRSGVGFGSPIDRRGGMRRQAEGHAQTPAVAA